MLIGRNSLQACAKVTSYASSVTRNTLVKRLFVWFLWQ